MLFCDLYNLRNAQFSTCTPTINIYYEILKVIKFEIAKQGNASTNLYHDLFLRPMV